MGVTVSKPFRLQIVAQSAQWTGRSITIPKGGSFSLLEIAPATRERFVFSILQKQAELAAAGITLSGNFLVHDGRPNVGVEVAGTQYRAATV